MKKLILLLLSIPLVFSCSTGDEELPPPTIKYSLTTAANPSDGGTVTPATGQHNEGTTVNITAIPSGEYLFSSWSGATGTTSSTSVLMNSNKTVTANFVKKQYPLTIEIEGEGTVTEKVIKAGTTTDYNSGTVVELTASPSEGWEFKEWQEDISGNENPTQLTIDSKKKVKAIFTTSINGAFQKGPYLNGTRIDLYELNEDLTQTGKSFTSTIVDNKGSYLLKDLALQSKFIQLEGLGYYFNEVLNSNSESQLSLSALHELDSNDLVNVNILTSIEKQRVSYLVENGMDFKSAKQKALDEILNNFNINVELDNTSEFLNLSDQGEGNAILLAISAIIQGYRSDADVSELISNISTDIRDNGVIDSKITGSKLLSHAEFLNPSKISENLIQKYEQLGEEIEISNFEPYLTSFLENSDFERNHYPIKYPQYSSDGRENILFLDKSEYTFDSNTEFTIKADFEVDGGLKIKISSTSGGAWYYAVGSNVNLNVSTPSSWTNGYKEQIFETPKNSKGISTDIKLFINPGTYKIEYYELGSDTPTRTRTISNGGGGSGGGNCNSDDWKLPINFDNCNIFDGVGGASVELSTDPEDSTNNTAKVINSGSDWETIEASLDTPISIVKDQNNIYSIRIYSNDEESHDLMIKLQSSNNDEYIELKKSFQGSGWNTVTFDMSEVTVQAWPNSGVAWDGTADFYKLIFFIDGGSSVEGTFHIDDIKKVE